MADDAPHLPIATLLDYWLHDTDAAATDAVDEHLMHCDACGRRLDELAALGDAVRSALHNGAVTAVTSGAFVQRLVAQGLKTRVYRLPPNGSVDCTVAPDDDVLVSRLEAPLEGVRRLDMVAELSIEPGVRHRWNDVPFDAASGEVCHVSKLAQIKQLPAHTLTFTLLAVEPGGTRELGRYRFCHRPWAGC